MLGVVDGQLETLVKDNAGQEIVLTTVGAGDAVGEMSMLDGRPRSATVRCTERALLLVLDRADLLAVLPRSPHLALDMMAQMAARARRVDDLLRSRVSRNVNEEVEARRTAVERVADAIAAFSGSIPFLVIHTIWFIIWIGWNVALLLPLRSVSVRAADDARLARGDLPVGVRAGRARTGRWRRTACAPTSNTTST